MTKKAEQVIEDLENGIEPEYRICEDCQGEGEIVAQEKITSTTIDIPYRTCDECQGQGVK